MIFCEPIVHLLRVDHNVGRGEIGTFVNAKQLYGGIQMLNGESRTIATMSNHLKGATTAIHEERATEGRHNLVEMFG